VDNTSYSVTLTGNDDKKMSDWGGWENELSAGDQWNNWETCMRFKDSPFGGKQFKWISPGKSGFVSLIAGYSLSAKGVTLWRGQNKKFWNLVFQERKTGDE